MCNDKFKYMYEILDPLIKQEIGIGNLSVVDCKCVSDDTGFWMTRVFRRLTIMAILTSEALLREKNPVTKCYPSGIRT